MPTDNILLLPYVIDYYTSFSIRCQTIVNSMRYFPPQTPLLITSKRNVCFDNFKSGEKVSNLVVVRLLRRCYVHDLTLLSYYDDTNTLICVFCIQLLVINEIYDC